VVTLASRWSGGEVIYCQDPGVSTGKADWPLRFARPQPSNSAAVGQQKLAAR